MVFCKRKEDTDGPFGKATPPETRVNVESRFAQCIGQPNNPVARSDPEGNGSGPLALYPTCAFYAPSFALVRRDVVRK